MRIYLFLFGLIRKKNTKNMKNLTSGVRGGGGGMLEAG